MVIETGVPWSCDTPVESDYLNRNLIIIKAITFNGGTIFCFTKEPAVAHIGDGHDIFFITYNYFAPRLTRHRFQLTNDKIDSDIWPRWTLWNPRSVLQFTLIRSTCANSNNTNRFYFT